MVNDFVLTDECEEILVDKDITVFIGPYGQTRAIFRIDENQDPLPHCDPNRFGYALTMINFIDGNEGIAICNVVSVSEFLANYPDFELEATEAV